MIGHPAGPANFDYAEPGAWLRNIWYAIGWGTEFAAGQVYPRSVAGERIAVYRSDLGDLTAVEDCCPHRFAPLSLGRVEGCELRCMYHGVKFARDGTCAEAPGHNTPPGGLRLRAFPLVERHKFAWIWIGDPGRADEGLIPDLGILDEADRRIHTGSLDYRAHYALINDNLLDFSHLSYVHEKTLGRPGRVIDALPEAAKTKPRIRGGSEAMRIDNGIRIEGWATGSAARIAVLPEDLPDGDAFSRIEFLVPGLLISRVQVFEPGAADRFEDGLPDTSREQPFCDMISVQAVTPTGSRATRYHYSLGAIGASESELDRAWALTLEAFAEDLAMIEAQQVVIDDTSGRSVGGIAADKGLVMFRKLMRRLIEAEAEPTEETAS